MSKFTIFVDPFESEVLLLVTGLSVVVKLETYDLAFMAACLEMYSPAMTIREANNMRTHENPELFKRTLNHLEILCDDRRVIQVASDAGKSVNIIHTFQPQSTKRKYKSMAVLILIVTLAQIIAFLI